ncbi:MAG: alpha/beta hydrolase [Caldilineaceae bacterium]
MLCYKIEGTGSPLLLIHGFGVTYNIWKNLAPLLTDHFQMVMIELPGIGQSPLAEADKSYYMVCAEEIEKLRQALQYKQWAIFSYSTGTRAAEAYIHLYPHSVRKAAFLCPIVLRSWRWYSLRRLAWLEHLYPALGDWCLSGWRLNRLVWLLGFNGHRHPYLTEWTDEISLQKINSLKATLRDIPDPGVHMLALPAPSLFIWGKYDLVPSKLVHQRANDTIIAANHSAPMVAAPEIARIAIPFFQAPLDTDLSL